MESPAVATVAEAFSGNDKKLEKGHSLGHYKIVRELGSGGMGDVLGGLISTLLAQSVPAYYAASSGMYWHGLAGDFCAKEIGPVGYSAIDVANALPKARAKIVASCNYESYCSS